MTLLWNNKKYKLVNEVSESDQMEFVIARKLKIQYNAQQPISIEFIKASFEIYGAFEKIEIFQYVIKETYFAHVTFKNSITAHAALIDAKKKRNSNLESIVPVHPHQQPDYSLWDSSKSHFYNLPPKVLLDVFGWCDDHSIVALSLVCNKIRDLLEDKISPRTFSFGGIVAANKFKNQTSSMNYAKDCLVTASRLIELNNSLPFHLEICVDKGFPLIKLKLSDWSYSKSYSDVLVNMEYYKPEWLSKLEPVVERVKCLYLRPLLEYDKLTFHINSDTVWPNVTVLSVTGYKSRVPDFTSVVHSLPKLERIELESLSLEMDIDNLIKSKYLKSIRFRDCRFKKRLRKRYIHQLADLVSKTILHFPLKISYKNSKYWLNSNDYGYEYDDVFDDDENWSYLDDENSSDLYDARLAKDSTDQDIYSAMDIYDIKKYLDIDISGIEDKTYDRW